MRTKSAIAVRRYRTTPDLIADELREDIQRGVVAPGHALRQEELAQRFGVSRLPIRDALLRLESEGIVTVFPNRGAYVAELSAAEVREIFVLRVLIECDALRQALGAMTPTDWRRVEDALDAGIRGGDGPDWASLDRAFHLALYAPMNRPRQLAMIASLRGTVDRYWRAYSELPSRTEEWLADHRAIVEAARGHHIERAVARLERHLDQAADVVVANLAD